MRLYLIIDETCFYQQNFVARFLEQTEDKVVGAALVTGILPKNNINRYLFKNFYYLTFVELVKLAVHLAKATFFDMVLPKKRGGEFYSVKSVLKFFNVDFIEVKNDLRERRYLDHIQSKSPDILISSNSLYFPEEVLKIPKVCSINRHSALLPSYGGLFPVLQAYLHGEKEVGASVHLMKKKIDGGEVLAQKKVLITPQESIADLYHKCFAASTEVVLESLRKIKKNDFSAVKNNYQPSYYSFPSKADWKMFRERGGRFI